MSLTKAKRPSLLDKHNAEEEALRAELAAVEKEGTRVKKSEKITKDK